MNDDKILQGAIASLPDPTAPKRFMTARGLAINMRRQRAFKGLDQGQLTRVLIKYYDGTTPQLREIRTSRLPSKRTLETLWTRVIQGESQDGTSPILREGTAEECSMAFEELSSSTLGDTEEYSAPDIFVSYSHEDENGAMEIARILEERGYSPWLAGERIQLGEPINDLIIAAINNCPSYLLYLTENSMASRWAFKEFEVRAGLPDRPFSLVLDGLDDRLYGLFTMKDPGDFGDFRNFKEWGRKLFGNTREHIYILNGEGRPGSDGPSLLTSFPPKPS